MKQIDQTFWLENKALVRSAIKDNPKLLNGWEFIEKSTQGGKNWEVLSDDFFRQLSDQFFASLVPFLKKNRPELLRDPDRGYSGYKSEGRNYRQVQDMDIKEIAQLVRQELPIHYPDVKFSVRIERYSGGQSMSIEASELPFPPFTPEYIALAKKITLEGVSHYQWEYRVGKNTEHGKIEEYTSEYYALKNTMQQVVNQYRMDDSDAMTDYFHVNFYDHVRINVEDWEKRLFPNDPMVIRKEELNRTWAEKKAKKDKAAQERKKSQGILPRGAIGVAKVRYRSKGETREGTFPYLIVKSPNGRGFSMDYNGWVNITEYSRVLNIERPAKNVSAYPGIQDMTWEQYWKLVTSIVEKPSDRTKKLAEKAWKTRKEWANIESETTPKEPLLTIESMGDPGYKGSGSARKVSAPSLPLFKDHQDSERARMTANALLLKLKRLSL